MPVFQMGAELPAWISEVSGPCIQFTLVPIEIGPEMLGAPHNPKGLQLSYPIVFLHLTEGPASIGHRMYWLSSHAPALGLPQGHPCQTLGMPTQGVTATDPSA